jgi:hypothetical protein
MAPLNGGVVLLFGHSDGIDIMNVHLVRVDRKGIARWVQDCGAYPFYDYGTGACETRDGSVTVCGVTKPVGGTNDVYLASLDPTANLQWERTLGGPGSDWASDVLITDSDELMISGWTTSTEGGDPDILLLKVTP